MLDWVRKKVLRQIELCCLSHPASPMKKKSKKFLIHIKNGHPNTVQLTMFPLKLGLTKIQTQTKSYPVYDSGNQFMTREGYGGSNKDDWDKELSRALREVGGDDKEAETEKEDYLCNHRSPKKWKCCRRYQFSIRPRNRIFLKTTYLKKQGILTIYDIPPAICYKYCATVVSICGGAVGLDTVGWVRNRYTVFHILHLQRNTTHR